MMKSSSHEGGHLDPQFRKWDTDRRRKAIVDLLRSSTLSPKEIRKALGTDKDMIALADAMVESAVGYAALPIGICRGLVVDGQTYDVPLVTEEPSVIAATTFAAGLVARHGGFRTRANPPITTAQVFLENARPGAAHDVAAAEPTIRGSLSAVLASMERRGGGYRSMDVRDLPETGLLRVQIHIDVRDAMGANLANSAAEAARPVLEQLTGGRCLMAILSNAADQRLASASFSIPVSALSKAELAGAEVARRITLASNLAQEDGTRAVTHNKGIMNGITAFMLATGNDTRAVEAGAHHHAGGTGSYRGLATYAVEGDNLAGTLELPLAAGTVGGAANLHPTSRLALAILGNPTATGLARIAAAVGLAQNLAALRALVSEGIQQGHMNLHQRRLDWKP